MTRPSHGIRRVLDIVTGEKIARGIPLSTDKIGDICLILGSPPRPYRSHPIIYDGCHECLLERKGHKHALLITKGFKDVLLIGNQSRPKIFDLNIRRPPPLYPAVVEVGERVTLMGFTSDPQAEEHAVQFDQHGRITRGYGGDIDDVVRCLSGEAVKILKRPGALSV